MGVCDEWGGAESRGNGARPVELMIMSDTCTTHRSRVPRRSSGRIKGGATTVEDERGPGLDFNLCFVCGSRPWGAAALRLCLFMLLKSFECSPVPASFFPFYELCYNHYYLLNYYYFIFWHLCTFVNILLYKVQFISFVYLMRIKMHDIVRYTV